MKRLLATLIFGILFLIPIVSFGASGDPLLVPGSTEITTLGTIATGTWEGTTVDVAHGGTGATTLTDGGVLLGSGTGAITAMGALADGSIVIGDGTTDPTTLAAFTSSTGTLKHESGGLEADIHDWSNGVPMVNGGATSMLTFYDEDDMSSDSATGIPSQQSVKAYVDNSVASSGGQWGAGSAKTVSSGSITLGGALYVIVTGEGDTTDSVTSLDGVSEGDVVILKGKASLGYTITFTDDNSNLDLQANFAMDNQNDTLVLLCIAAGTPDTFIEISRASNG